MKTNLRTELSDETLLCNFRESGNGSYFELLVDRYRNRLYSIAFNLLGNDSEAEEVVQEAFIRVWRNCDKFRTDASFAGWIFTIIQNLCKDNWRTKKRKQNYELAPFNSLALNEPGDILSESKQINRSSEYCEPAKAAEIAELRATFSTALERLPQNQKRVIVLRELEGLSYKDIAYLTDVSIGTVRSRIHYARQKLRAMINQSPF